MTGLGSQYLENCKDDFVTEY